MIKNKYYQQKNPTYPMMLVPCCRSHMDNVIEFNLILFCYPKEDITELQYSRRSQKMSNETAETIHFLQLSFYLQSLVWVAVKMALTLRGGASVTPCASITGAAALTLRPPVA